MAFDYICWAYEVVTKCLSMFCCALHLNLAYICVLVPFSLRFNDDNNQKTLNCRSIDARIINSNYGIWLVDCCSQVVNHHTQIYRLDDSQFLPINLCVLSLVFVLAIYYRFLTLFRLFDGKLNAIIHRYLIPSKLNSTII